MSVAAPHLLIASSGSFLVTPNVGIMIWTLVVFAISLFILNKAVFPRIGAALDARQHAIEESIDAAERTRHEADQLLSEYREQAPGRAGEDQARHRGRNAQGDRGDPS